MLIDATDLRPTVRTSCSMAPQTKHEFGQVTNPYACSPGHPCALNMHAMNYISSLLEANPVLYLDKIQDNLCALDINVSLATIFHAL